MLCLHCGYTLEDGDAYCEGCGQRVEAITYITCAHCGQLMEMGDVFCEYCGNKVSGAPPHQPSSQVTNTDPPQTHNVQSPPLTPQRTPAAVPNAQSQPRMLLVILLDASNSGVICIDQMASGLNKFISDSGKDGKVLCSLDLAVIQFAESYGVINDFSTLANTSIVQQQSTNSSYCAPIREALRMVDEYSRNNAKIYKPWVVLISTSEPADDISAVTGDIQSLQSSDKLRFMALGVLDYDAISLKRLTDVVFQQKGMDFTDFFDWLCRSVKIIVRSKPGEKPQLPPLQGSVYRDK